MNIQDFSALMAAIGFVACSLSLPWAFSLARTPVRAAVVTVLVACIASDAVMLTLWWAS